MFERDSIYFNRVVTYKWNNDLIPDTYAGAKNKISSCDPVCNT